MSNCEHKNTKSIEYGFSWCINCGALSDSDQVQWRLPNKPTASVVTHKDLKIIILANSDDKGFNLDGIINDLHALLTQGKGKET